MQENPGLAEPRPAGSATTNPEGAALVVSLPPGRGFHEKAGPCQAQNDFGSLNHERPSPTNGRRHTWAYHHER